MHAGISFALVIGRVPFDQNGTKMEQKFSGNSFRKFWFTSRLSFFWKFGNSAKFPVPFGLSTRYELAPVPVAVKSYKMAASLKGWFSLATESESESYSES